MSRSWLYCRCCYYLTWSLKLCFISNWSMHAVSMKILDLYIIHVKQNIIYTFPNCFFHETNELSQELSQHQIYRQSKVFQVLHWKNGMWKVIQSRFSSGWNGNPSDSRQGWTTGGWDPSGTLTKLSGLGNTLFLCWAWDSSFCQEILRWVNKTGKRGSAPASSP